jgi:hypothetical protein
MIVVGAHYLPFGYLYGMVQFEILGAALIGAGLVIGLYVPIFSLGAWVSFALFLGFALVARSVVAKERNALRNSS